MGLGRRKIRLEDASAWVFNRMADVYDARPPYPTGLIDALAELAEPGRRVVDLGAGIGHVALPLAARGLEVTAVEPAAAMLARLRRTAAQRGLRLHALHATAESLPTAAAALDLVVIVDALHFLDAERVGREVGRVLTPGGALAIAQCEPADTPFMRDLVALMGEAAPRRPRAVAQPSAQLAALAGVTLGEERLFHDETPVDELTLERILRSISFIGPAMNPARFAAFRARVHALPHAPAWARTFRLRFGWRRRS